MDNQQTLPVLNDAELRVLGALMEKSKTTPDYYPMTLNGLTAACNQKSARKPVVDYDESNVTLALDTLKRKGLISTATGGSSRAVKYKHNFAIVFPLAPAEVSVLCLLILRGPQTPGEINTNSGRMYEFENLDEVQTLLEKLASGDAPYIVQLPKRPGQKEARYRHLLGGTIPEDDAPDDQPRRSSSEMEERLTKVEVELAELKEAFDKLMKELM
ncbi:YceH family protein [Mucilaginibacter segetis]|uniref:YceH family protein n=1 Tax=Mucilaginibacter segetis TaxID=2793071 RepID=A0A934PUD6_9SPHI|nr:YceH family protein [Mucilaginibacter segetis]MBK0381018.1 YceH family protein [Mucilaginibacter segetis]